MGWGWGKKIANFMVPNSIHLKKKFHENNKQLSNCTIISVWVEVFRKTFVTLGIEIKTIKQFQ